MEIFKGPITNYAYHTSKTLKYFELISNFSSTHLLGNFNIKI